MESIKKSKLELSVIIPTFNRKKVLLETISSIQTSITKNIEVIIVDDGSSDGTNVALEGVLRTISGLYFYQSNKGVSEARNFGVSRASGEYLLFLDSDDKLSDAFFEDVLHSLQKQPDIVFVGVDFYLDNTFQKTILPNKPYGKQSDDGLYLAGSYILKKDLFLSVGGFDPKVKYGENTELAIRLKEYLKEKIFINKSLLKVYQAVNDRSSSKPQNMIESIEYVLSKHDDYFNRFKKLKSLYHGNLAVQYSKVCDIEKAKYNAWLSFICNPLKMNCLLRLVLLFLPSMIRSRYYG